MLSPTIGVKTATYGTQDIRRRFVILLRINMQGKK